MRPQNILILGASYGALLGAKLLFGGHKITLVCTSRTAHLINDEGVFIRIPIKGRKKPVQIETRKLPGVLSAIEPDDVDPSHYNLVCLAMQEPQYRLPAVRRLLLRIAQNRMPCMSIMNMPPLAYLKRIRGLDVETLRPAYTEPSVWDNFDPTLMTLCSPDPQAFRPQEGRPNVLEVTLPTNFKAAQFVFSEHKRMLLALEAAVDTAIYDCGDGIAEVPVKLKIHDSIHVPLAKWPMLVTGNYRCITVKGVRSIYEAVHANLEESRLIYQWVTDLCMRLGALPSDLVPFEKYANATKMLVRPSSAARGILNGATTIERVDKLVLLIGQQFGNQNELLRDSVAFVDRMLAANSILQAPISTRC